MVLSGPRSHVAVLGGGLQGCCIALVLAERGARVTVYDRNDTLISQRARGRASVGDPRCYSKGALGTWAPEIALALVAQLT